ncbi:MAG: alpha-L-fucosidase [Bacteroidales bacterium]|nr:alpha-L-fucosidase [Bacteroidales bacterium]
MKKTSLLSACVALCCASALTACTKAPEPFGPVPSPAQIEWQKMEMNMFVHFGPNTFSGLEWGTGAEPEDLFRPTALDCRQWARTAKAAGMKGIIITAKHHDGFCLWPNPVSPHSVKDIDVLKELSDACREEGVKFGVYISPWDRNDPSYGTPEYNLKYAETLRSVHDGSYGPIFEQWFDGACGEGPNGKRQEYDWPLFNATVSELQPDAIQFSDSGPGCRWVGNEKGIAGETNWSTLNTAGFTPGAGGPPAESLSGGDEDGTAWIPAEADVSIRPGWFWRASEDDRIKTTDELMDIWYSSVGRNALLLLNVPADTRGRIPQADSLRLMEFRNRRDDVFAVNLASGPSRLTDGDYDSYAVLRKPEVTLKARRSFNLIMLQEYIPLGQRISSFKVEAYDGGRWQEIAGGTTVGYKRILRIPECTARKVRITVTGAKATPVLSELGLYMDAAKEP